jgi:hypothetical protein
MGKIFCVRAGICGEFFAAKTAGVPETESQPLIVRFKGENIMLQSLLIISLPLFTVTVTLLLLKRNPPLFHKQWLTFASLELLGVLFITTIIVTILRGQPEQLYRNALSIIKSLATLAWFLAEFFLLILFINIKHKNLRTSFIRASLYFSVFIWLTTELLSFFVFLNFTGCMWCHIVYDIVLLILFLKRRRTKGPEIRQSYNISFRWEYCFFSIILCITFFIAFVFPPNNWDSMTYHLPRIEHWFQNNTLRHYFSSINRQLISAPFAEMSILQGRIISGDNWLMNLEQWFAFSGTAIGISLIASHLGLNKKTQITAALFFLTLPMAILQSTSTQTDLVEAFFIICMAERFLVWKKDGNLHNSIDFGIALGLCVLTKGSAYPIAFAFVCYFAIISIRQFKNRLSFAFMAAIICLALNMPHYIRNQISFSNPIGTHGGVISNFTLKQFLLSSFFNLYSNIPFPLPVIGRKINEFLALQDRSIFPFGPGQIIGTRNWIKTFAGQISFSEDSVRNGFHLLLIIVSFILILSKKQKSCYPWLVLFSWLAFFYLITWQPWITRLQVPLFALSAPVFALAFREEKNDAIICRIKKPCLVFLCCFALLPLFLNDRRPVLYIPKLTNNKLIWNTSRNELIFNGRNNTYMKNYLAACDIISKEQPDKIGIIIGGDSWEYPLWYYIKHNTKNMPNITHQNVADIDENVDVLFVLERNDIAFIGNVQGIRSPYPYILKRNSLGWDIIYAPD